jgi:hypothetical protein
MVSALLQQMRRRPLESFKAIGLTVTMGEESMLWMGLGTSISLVAVETWALEVRLLREPSQQVHNS